MIQSNHSVSGRAIDTPRLVVDNGHIYWGRFETPARLRVIFEMPDDEVPWGATLYWGNKSQRYAYYQEINGIIRRIEHIPGLPDTENAAPGSYEGDALVYASKLSRLTISADGLHLQENGQDWTWAMMTGFSDYYLWKLGRKDWVRALWTQARDLGANGRRILGMMKYIAPFDPREFGQSYFDDMPGFVEEAEDYDQRIHWDVYADNQIYNFGLDFFNTSVEVLRPLESVVIGGGNEWPKNGWNPFNLPYPGVFSSQGSTLADQEPPATWRGQVLRCFHGRRAPYPKEYMAFDDAVYVTRGLRIEDGELVSYAPYAPTVGDEMMGFAEIDIEGRRSTDPNLARTQMLSGKAFGVGVTGHFEDSIYGRLLGPIQQTCARAMYGAK